MNKETRSDLAAALSLANLSLLGVWDALLNYTSEQEFFFGRPPSRGQYLAAMTNVVLIGLVFFVGLRVVRRAQDRFGAWVSAPLLLVLCLPAANAGFRLLATSFPRLGRTAAAAILLCLFGAGLVLLRKFYPQHSVYAAAVAGLVTLSPLIPIEAIASFSRCRIDRSAEYAGRALAPRITKTPSARIVWIVFDELDYRLSFPERPRDVAMPQFDRLRAESLFAENAISPSSATVISMPALLTGVKMSSIVFSGPTSAIADGVPLSERPTIFSTIHAMGGNTAVDGWYLPYCRLFAQDLAECSWHAIDQIVNETRGTFPEILARQQQSLFEYGYYSIFRESLRANHRVAMLHALHEEALRDVADPSLNLVVLHLPVPHPPFFYDRLNRTYSKRNAGQEGYRDGLALADVFLGDIRGAMTQAGLWDTSTILVSSDHQNRSAMQFDGKTDVRVPFLLKLAGHSTALPYRDRIQTVVTKPLLEAVFQGRVASPEDAASWLAAHRQ